MNVHPRSVVCHPEKKTDGKSEYLLPTAPSKPVAPRFLQGLSDLKVMDGSQVTMTVQVSGLPLHLFPWGVCRSGHGCNTGICPWRPTQITGLPGNRMGCLSVSGPREAEPLGPSFCLLWIGLSEFKVKWSREEDGHSQRAEGQVWKRSTANEVGRFGQGAGGCEMLSGALFKF